VPLASVAPAPPSADEASVDPPTEEEPSLRSATEGPNFSLDSTNWTARIRCKEFEVDSSFSIYVFVGKESDIPDDARQWVKSPYLVGCDDVFLNGDPDQCSNCMDNADLVIEDYVQLDDHLWKSLQTVDKNVVEPYLKENLHWRVAKVSI
jgi:tyrosinase